MMEAGKRLWAGILNGISVVHDPNIQLPNSRWVLLYAVPHQRLIAYQKSHARSVTHAPSDPDTRTSALQAYETWRRTVPTSVLEQAVTEVRRKDAFLA